MVFLLNDQKQNHKKEQTYRKGFIHLVGGA